MRLIISTKKTALLFGVCAFGLAPLDAYLSFGGTPITLDRLFLLIFLVTSIKSINKCFDSRTFRLAIYFSYCLLTVVLASFLLNVDSKLPIIVAYFFYIFIFILALSMFYSSGSDNEYRDNRYLFYRIMIFWVIISTVFCAWAFYNQFFLGELIYPTFLELSGTAEQRFKTQMAHLRFFLPFSSAPALGFMCFGLIVVLILDFGRKPILNNIVFFLLLAVLFVIALGTQSRSSAYAFFVAMIFLYVSNFSSTLGQFSPKFIKYLLTFILTSVLGLASFYVFDPDIGRLTLDFETIKESRHSSIRLRTLEIIFSSSYSNFFWGHGVGTLIDWGIAPYSFTSYLTVFYELGLFGLITYLACIFLPVIALVMRKPLNGREYMYRPRHVLTLYLYIFCTNIFYEVKLLPIAAIFLAYNVYIAKLSISNSSNLSFDKR